MRFPAILFVINLKKKILLMAGLARGHFKELFFSGFSWP
jgi:hypothetical protein